MHVTCQKCGKTMDDVNFYTYKDGTKTEYCKKCLTMHIDNFEPDTFLWLLKKMDVPYVPIEWNTLRDRAYEKDPRKMNGMSVFGKYLSKMRLKMWKDYHWSDSEQLQKTLALKEASEEQINAQAELKRQFENHEITEAQYKTLLDTNMQYQEMLKNGGSEAYSPVSGPQKNNPYTEDNLIDKSILPDLTSDLTQDDKIYLAMKWGADYPISDQIKLEQKFKEMSESFDIADSDTIGTLILICKTFLKLNQAIDVGDMDSYNKLARVYDSLRKSAKFTAAQNKEKKSEFLDSVGELVAYCEKVGGQIPSFEINADKDVVDTIIRDNREYIKSLISEDTALARQIEAYIQKREIADQQRRDRELARQQGQSEVQIQDDDFQAHYDRIQEEIQQDNELLNEEEEEGYPE